MADELPPSSPKSETPPPRTTGGNFRWEPPTAEELQAMMPGYTIEKLLGRGGMGAVYRGVQTNLDRPVAIKILPPGVEKEDPSFAERFKSEARLMAKLNHPAVVAVYDFGNTSAGQLYFAMEYVDGSDVSQMIAAQGKLPPEHALAITAHVCDALSAAHELGIVHRDIKPANVLLNMKGQVKVADFGLAKVEEPGQHGLTKTGYAMGTPDFVAPEALTLGTGIDGRADLYAVGVMLYQMLTGNIPRGAFKPASALVPGLDPRFDPIIMKAMQHDREERHQNAAELRRELDVILTVPLVRNDAPVSAAIPVAQVAEAPGKRSAAQKPQQRSAGAPTRQPSIKAGEGTRAPETPPKSKTPLFLGLVVAAAIGIGAFVMLRSGSRETSAERPPATVSSSAPAGTLTSSATMSGSKAPAPASSGSRETSAARPSVTASTAPSAKAVTSTAQQPRPSEQQFPPGQWVKVFGKFEDLPDELRDPKSKRRAKWDAGWIQSALPGVQLNLAMPSTLSGNYALRARFRQGANNLHGIFFRRQPGDNSGLYQLRLSENTLSCQRRERERYHLVSSGTAASAKVAADEFTLEFAALGSKFFGRLDSRLLCAGTDTTHSSGVAGLYVNDMAVRDIEVINLDGLSEAEALRIIGVDEKGHDLRQPAAVVSTSPTPSVPARNASRSDAGGSKSPLPVSASSDKPPPGQWVKMFTKPEDLPEGWMFKSGRLVSNGAAPVALNFTKSDVRNFGVKLRVQIVDSAGQTHIRLRRKTGMYSLGLLKGGTLSLRHLTAASGGEISALGKKPDPDIKVVPGDEVEMEFATVGKQLVARLNGRLIGFATDDRLREGYGSLHNEVNKVSDLEVINLDGLSEAEALRILGVDEKGNDLRALAAKQEQQQMEQAKAADALAAIPELKALHEQFVKLQAERVTAPFEAEVAKLNAGYVGGIDREIASEKKAGHLDGVIALEAEKKQVKGARTPSSAVVGGDAGEGTRTPDDVQTTAALKKLRDIYRAAYAKIEATRAENLKALTDPLDARLQQMEATLTQQDRIAHAKTVREYREGLVAEAKPPITPPPTPTPTGTTNTALPVSKYPKGDDRKAAEWALTLGGTVTIREDGKETNVSKVESLPKGKFDLVVVSLSFNAPNQLKAPFENLDPLAGLQELERLETRYVPLEDRHMPILASLPRLTILSVMDAMLTDDFCRHLIGTKTLERLTLFKCRSFTGTGLESLSPESLQSISLSDSVVTDASLALLPRFKHLTELHLTNLPITDAVLPSLNELRELTYLKFMTSGGGSGVMKVTLEGLDKLKSLKKLSRLGWTFTPGRMPEEAAVIARVFPDLAGLDTTSLPFSAEDIAAFSACRRLTYLGLVGPGANDAAVQGVLRLLALEVLSMKISVKITDAGLSALAAHKSLQLIVCNDAPDITDAGLVSLAKLKPLQRLEVTNCAKLTTAGIEAFKKARPDVKLTR